MKIAIWGTGKRLISVLSRLDRKYEVIFFIDSNEEKNGMIYFQKEVISPDRLKDKVNEIEGILISVLDRVVQTQICQNVVGYKGIKVGITKEYSIEWKGNDNDIFWMNISGKEILPYLEVNVVDSCNLNCKACTHFSNLYTNEDGDYGIECFEKDLFYLKEHVDLVKFRLLGGEPLICENIDRYISVSRRAFPNTDIELVTNGLKIPSMKQGFFDVLRKNNVGIFVSMYKPTSKIKDQIFERLEKEDIRYDCSGICEEFIRILNPEGNSNINNSYRRCEQKNCFIIEKGRFYRCPIEATIKRYFEKFYNGIPYEVDLEGKIIRDIDDWHGFIHEICNPFGLCRFCDENGGSIISWQTTTCPDMKDWAAWGVQNEQ